MTRNVQYVLYKYKVRGQGGFDDMISVRTRSINCPMLLTYAFLEADSLMKDERAVLAWVNSIFFTCSHLVTTRVKI